MIRFAPDGSARAWSPADPLVRLPAPLPDVVFDAPAAWAIVRSLLEEPGVEVQWIFVYQPLAARILESARAAGAADDLIERAAAVLRQPADSDRHDDHLHVRVFCAPEDRIVGCVDRGPVRWWKKRWKSLGERPFEPSAPSRS